ncbi:hypothetical protein ABT024_39505 [Streptomyces sp. NPDC002812]|uniref:hypothetical protein n=1 Tax=Streptomyces sp. NPDC002812 TaxID=3154434 RepID=UPI003327A192
MNPDEDESATVMSSRKAPERTLLAARLVEDLSVLDVTGEAASSGAVPKETKAGLIKRELGIDQDMNLMQWAARNNRALRMDSAEGESGKEIIVPWQLVSPYFQVTEASEQPTWNRQTSMFEGGSHNVRRTFSGRPIR